MFLFIDLIIVGFAVWASSVPLDDTRNSRVGCDVGPVDCENCGFALGTFAFVVCVLIIFWVFGSGLFVALFFCLRLFLGVYILLPFTDFVCRFQFVCIL